MGSFRLALIILISSIFSILLIYIVSRVVSLGYFNTRESYDKKRNSTEAITPIAIKTTKKEK